MGDYTIKRIAAMEAIYAGSFRRARAELGVESFGMAILDFPPGADRYPAHDHSHDGQEEVYVVLSGSGEIEVDGEVHRLDTETLVRVGPATRRKLRTRDESMRLLALGGVPGHAYQAPDWTRLGEPDSLDAAR